MINRATKIGEGKRLLTETSKSMNNIDQVRGEMLGCEEKSSTYINSLPRSSFIIPQKNHKIF